MSDETALHHPSLRDRVVIVTGGGRGLGREMALALVGAGCRVVVTSAREAGELAEVEEEARALAGQGRLAAVRADVRRWEDCEAVVARTLELFGGLHALVNNAGRGLLLISPTFTTEPARFWEAPVEGWREIVETNVVGPFLMARAAAPCMVERGFGRIVNISTSDRTMVRVGYSPYGPSKAALEANSVIWAQDLAGTGVTVNVLIPGGAADTAMIPDHAPFERSALNPPSVMVAPVCWLASAASDGVTGWRFIGADWDPGLPDAEAAHAAGAPAAWAALKRKAARILP